MEAPTLTHHCVCGKKNCMKNYDMFIIRLDLDEILAKTKKHQLFSTKFVTKSSFPIKAKFGGDKVEDPRRRSIFVSLPISPPIKRHCQNTIPYIRQVFPRKTFFLPCPAQFCEFRSEILTSYLNHVCKQTQSLIFFFFFFRRDLAA